MANRGGSRTPFINARVPSGRNPGYQHGASRLKKGSRIPPRYGRNPGYQHGMANSQSIDENARLMASQVLLDAIASLGRLKDDPELSVHERLQANLAIVKLIASSK